MIHYLIVSTELKYHKCNPFKTNNLLFSLKSTSKTAILVNSAESDYFLGVILNTTNLILG